MGIRKPHTSRAEEMEWSWPQPGSWACKVAGCLFVVVQLLSRVQLFATPWQAIYTHTNSHPLP